MKKEDQDSESVRFLTSIMIPFPTTETENERRFSIWKEIISEYGTELNNELVIT
jgi:hypothetical protein